MNAAARTGGSIRKLATSAAHAHSEELYTAQVLATYRRFLRASSQFSDSNLREFIQKKARDGFRKHMDAPTEQIPSLLERALQDLTVVEEQAGIRKLFASTPRTSY